MDARSFHRDNLSGNGKIEVITKVLFTRENPWLTRPEWPGFLER
ncbi:hypothetical protein [Thermococcus sp.]